MVNWKRRKYSRDEFAAAWLGSSSIAQVAKKLGCNTTGGGYITLKFAAQELGLDNTHMTGQGWNIGWQSNPAKERAIPLSNILVKNSTYTTDLETEEASSAGRTFRVQMLSVWSG
jgi:hypothetical protein